MWPQPILISLHPMEQRMHAIIMHHTVVQTGIVGGLVVLEEVDNGAGLLPTMDMVLG